MSTSVFLAQLIGPVLVAGAIGILSNPAAFRALATTFLESPPLIFLSGLLTMTAGVAILLHHNIWTADWRGLITLLGWAASIGGAARIISPSRTAAIGTAVMTRLPQAERLGGAIWLGAGLLFCFVGYLR